MRLRRPFAAGSVLGAIAHHGFETRAGVGLVFEPQLGRRGAYALWGTLFPLMLLSAAREGSADERLAAINSGIGAAGVAVHFAAWPWSLHKGVPMLDEAEGLTEEQLPAYNSVLWFWAICSVLSLATEASPRVPAPGPDRRRDQLPGAADLGPPSLPLGARAGRARARALEPGAARVSRRPMSADPLPELRQPRRGGGNRARRRDRRRAARRPPDRDHGAARDPRACSPRAGLAATFFVEGLNAELYPEACCGQIDAGGHEVAFHAWRHEQWGELSAAAQAENLARGLAAFERLGLRRRAVFARRAAGSARAGSRSLREAGLRYCSPAGRGRRVEDGDRPAALRAGATSTRPACCRTSGRRARAGRVPRLPPEEELRGARDGTAAC